MFDILIYSIFKKEYYRNVNTKDGLSAMTIQRIIKTIVDNMEKIINNCGIVGSINTLCAV